MKKNLKYISILILIILMNGCFSDPINVAPKCSFGVESEYNPKEETFLYYKCKKEDNNYKWNIKFISIPKASSLKSNDIQNGTSYNTKIFIPDVPGEYKIYSEVSDEYGAIDIDTKTINIRNSAPSEIIESYGSSKYYTINKTMFLSSMSSVDEDGIIENYEWSFKKVPEGSKIFDFKSIERVIKIIPDKPGDYLLLLRVTDNNKTSSYASYGFYVNANSAPKIKSTLPDYNIELIEIKKDIKETFTVEVLDNSEYLNLDFTWSISINDEPFKRVYNGFSFILNSSNYAIGDLIKLKVEISDKELSSSVIWNIIIIK